jgi:DNA polymerase epsilon subunit 2
MTWYGFHIRFTHIEQRVKRNKMFAPPAISLSNNVDYIELSKIESLLGVTGVRRVLGMIGQDERKKFFLEDHTSRIYIDLTHAVSYSFIHQFLVS